MEVKKNGGGGLTTACFSHTGVYASAAKQSGSWLRLEGQSLETKGMRGDRAAGC